MKHRGFLGRLTGGRAALIIFAIVDLILTVTIFIFAKSIYLLLLKYCVMGVFLYKYHVGVLFARLNWRMDFQLEKGFARFKLIERLNEILVSDLNFKDGFTKFIQELQNEVDFDSAQLIQVEDDEHSFVFASYDGGEIRFAEDEQELETNLRLARVMRTKKKNITWNEEYGSILQLPLVCRDKIIGVFVLCHQEKGSFFGDLEYLQPIINRLTMSFQNSLLYKRTKELTLKDYLTGTANRRALDLRLEKEYSRAKDNQKPFSVLIVDIDHFKLFNDSHGHLAGDQALRELADLMKEQIRQVDFVSRFGGEEFVIVLPETSRDGAILVAERIRQIVADHSFTFDGKELSLTISIGVATYSEETDSIRELLHGADIKLYSAKNCGRNQVVQLG